MFLQKTCGFCLKRDFEKERGNLIKKTHDEQKLEKKLKSRLKKILNLAEFKLADWKKLLNLAEFNLPNAQIT